MMRSGRKTIVKESSDDLHVVRGACETACASAVVDGGDFRGGDEEGPAVGVVAGPDLGAFGRHGFLVHMG